MTTMDIINGILMLAGYIGLIMCMVLVPAIMSLALDEYRTRKSGK